MTNAVKAERRQFCILHASKHLLFTLLEGGMSRDERIEVEEAVKHTLYRLVNSAKKHLKHRQGTTKREDRRDA